MFHKFAFYVMNLQYRNREMKETEMTVCHYWLCNQHFSTSLTLNNLALKINPVLPTILIVIIVFFSDFVFKTRLDKRNYCIWTHNRLILSQGL